MTNSFVWTTSESRILLRKALVDGLALANERVALIGEEADTETVAQMLRALELLEIPEQTSLICPSCHVDRFKKTCPKVDSACGLTGIAYSIPSDVPLNPFKEGEIVYCTKPCSIPQHVPLTVRLTRPGFIGLVEIPGRFSVDYFQSVLIPLSSEPAIGRLPKSAPLYRPPLSMENIQDRRRLFETSFNTEQLVRQPNNDYANPSIQTEWLLFQIAFLKRCVENLHTTAIAAAEEIQAHWAAHCDAEGYGPVNLMHRLERGIGAGYPGYSFGQFTKAQEEISKLTEQLSSVPATPFTWLKKVILHVKKVLFRA